MRNHITIDENEAFLRQVSKPVDFNDKELAQDIKDLEEYVAASPVFAMASVQIGIPKRIICVKNTDPDTSKGYAGTPVCFINPEIISQKGRTEYLEACRSCLNFGAVVERPYQIVLRYQDIQGNTLTQQFEGFAATVLSHEVDHLDGIFHMDRAKEVFEMAYEERNEFRKTRPYKVYSKTCPFSYKPIEKQK